MRKLSEVVQHRVRFMARPTKGTPSERVLVKATSARVSPQPSTSERPGSRYRRNPRSRSASATSPESTSVSHAPRVGSCQSRAEHAALESVGDEGAG